MISKIQAYYILCMSLILNMKPISACIFWAEEWRTKPTDSCGRFVLFRTQHGSEMKLNESWKMRSCWESENLWYKPIPPYVWADETNRDLPRHLAKDADAVSYNSALAALEQGAVRDSEGHMMYCIYNIL